MYIKHILYIHFFYYIVFCYSENYENLYKWMMRNGAYISNKIIPIEETIYNRYIIAKEKIYQKEELVFIPDNLTISTLNNLVYNKCTDDFKEFLSYAEKEEKYSFDYDCLVYFLTIDIENKNSIFRDYYNYLPEISKLDFPIYFTEDEKRDFNKIELETQIRRQDLFFNKSLKPIKNKILKIPNGLEKFKKSFIYVSTRNFGRRESFYDDVNTLVPFLDLLNHSNNFNTYFYFNEKRNGFVLYSTKDIEPNEEITSSYGKFNNIYLYSMYGFTMKNNIYSSSIHIKIEKESFTLFEKIRESEIIKIVKHFNPKKEEERNEIILKIKNALEDKLSDYQQFFKKYKDNINIINICEDLDKTAKLYIELCKKLLNYNI